MRKYLFVFLISVCVVTITAQTNNILQRQRLMFPQEKVYVMTDRDLYISGDTVWMRPWIYDCNTAKPQSKSKYVYIELRDAADNLIKRIKIINNDGRLDGYIPLPPDLKSGDYTLCGYTYYMTGTTDEMYFKKRLHIMKSADINAGLYPVNLQTPDRLLSSSKEKPTETLKPDTWTSTVPIGSQVSVSVTNDNLCLADTTSSVVWSLKHQPELFTIDAMRAIAAQNGGNIPLYSPTVPYEIGQIICGTVFGNISTKKRQADIKVSIMIPKCNIMDVKTTGTDGRFLFQGFNLPDSTLVYLAGKKGKHTTMDNIVLDDDSLPEQIHPLPATPHYFKRTKTNEMNTDFRLVSSAIDLVNTQLLEEVVVEGHRREKPGDEYDNTAQKTMRAKDFEELNCFDVRSALRVMAGLNEMAGVYYYRNQKCNIYVDDLLETDYNDADDGDVPGMSTESPALDYPIEIVERIDLLRPEDAAFLSGAAGSGAPAICITLKEGADLNKYNGSSVKSFYPLGYQQHKDFTAHDTTMAWPVLYWNPYITVVSENTLRAIVQKVLATSLSSSSLSSNLSTQSPQPSSFTIHIDGFTTDGRPVHEQVTFTK